MQIMIKIVESHQSRAMSQPSKGAVGGHDLSDIICPELVKSLLVIIIVEYLREVIKNLGILRSG